MSGYPVYLVNGFLAVNILLSLGIAYVCVCRIAVMSRESTRKLFRLRYVFMLVAALANLGSPWMFSEQPGPGAVMLAFALLCHLVASVGLWRDGVPADGLTTPGDLYRTNP